MQTDINKILNLQSILTIIITICLIVTVVLIKNAIIKFSVLKRIEAQRKKVILYFSYLFLYFFYIICIAYIWGVHLKELGVYISSFFAVIGIGFFAQWSILSNITASIILFISHPLRIGNRIRILDKDFDHTGTVVDITGFFLFLKTDTGENITFPTSLILQKGIQLLGDQKSIKENSNQSK